MKTCETCRWWDCNDPALESTGICRHSNIGEQIEIEIPDVSFYLDSVLWFSKDFGCVHHEEKTDGK